MTPPSTHCAWDGGCRTLPHRATPTCHGGTLVTTPAGPRPRLLPTLKGTAHAAHTPDHLHLQLPTEPVADRWLYGCCMPQPLPDAHPVAGSDPASRYLPAIVPFGGVIYYMPHCRLPCLHGPLTVRYLPLPALPLALCAITSTPFPTPHPRCLYRYATARTRYTASSCSGWVDYALPARLPHPHL